MQATGCSAGMPWERADLFFLSDALARGMSIQELAGFLNRSEDELDSKRVCVVMNPYLHPTARPASAIAAQQKTGLLSPPYLLTLGQSDEPQQRV
jgi:hypothetical protein